jgi:2-polyprenyl-3-methyl-5-hydroxy-6-metoxy-1,4-benzoquinol methylase
MQCPVCPNQTNRIFEVKREYWIRECNACRHQFAECTPAHDHASTIYTDDYFFNGGQGYSDYLSYSGILKGYGRRYAQLLSAHMRPGELLDVGAAAGFTSDGFRSAGWDTEGIDPNATMVKYAQNRLGLSFRAATLENFETSRDYDLIVMIQVIGHFTDPCRALSTAANLTRPGGFWLIETWNSRSLTARIFGPHWHEYSPPGVLHYFNPSSLGLLCGRFGMSRVAWGRPRKRVQLGHAASLVAYHLGDSVAAKGLRLLPGRASVPYPSEDVFWTLFRKETP